MNQTDIQHDESGMFRRLLGALRCTPEHWQQVLACAGLVPLAEAAPAAPPNSTTAPAANTDSDDTQ